MFVDTAKIYLKAGNGGNGVVSFHREKYIAAGGPDGGDGGKGGNVIFQVDEGMSTLIDFKYRRKFIADSGEDGKPSNSAGKSGSDIIIKVPLGTLVKDAATNNIIMDLTEPGEQKVILYGGKGGKGNQHFATPTRQIPNFAQAGVQGDELEVVLELMLLADVGLVGFPNVGKSTLISMVSGARPKIADYHFTTLEPNLGVVDMGDGNSFVIADIPGIIEGAHEGIGLGHKFLRHIERTRLLIHVIDMGATEGRDPYNDYKIINNELSEYSIKLENRPQIIAANKMDVTGAEDNLELFKAEFRQEFGETDIEIVPISAATNEGVDVLINKVYKTLKELPPIVFVEKGEERVIYKPKEEKSFEITVDDSGKYCVTGKMVDRLINSTNFNDYESLQHFQKFLNDKGIIKALKDKGIREGDIVKIDDMEFDFVL